MGIAEFALTPARYLAQVSAPGYLTQTIEFEVGSQDLTDFPIVSLVETANPVLRNLQYTNHLFVREWGRWMEQFRNLAQTRVMYEKVFILQILLTVISVSVVVIKKLKFSPVQNAKLPHGIRDFIGAMLFFTGHIIRFFVEFFLMVCFVFGMFFLSEYAGFKGGMFMLGACVNLAIWMWYLWLQKKSV
jgi:hypothetical protein